MLVSGMYSKSVEELDLSTLTELPYPDVVAARVASVKDHAAKAKDQPTWHIVQLDLAGGKQAEVRASVRRSLFLSFCRCSCVQCVHHP